MPLRHRVTPVVLLATLALGLPASAQRRGGWGGGGWGGGGGGGMPVRGVPAGPVYRPGPVVGVPVYRPGPAYAPQVGGGGYRPAPVYAPQQGPVVGVPVQQGGGGWARPGPVYAPQQGPVVGTPVYGGGYRPAPVVGVVRPGGYPVAPGYPLYPGWRTGGYAQPARYPVYGNYVPLVTRYQYHPEYFSYIPGGMWFVQQDYLAAENTVYIARLREFMDQIQGNLGARVQNGELPPEVAQQAQDERNYIEQVIAGDQSATGGMITPDQRVQLRELVDGMLALQNVQPQAMMPMDSVGQ